MAVWATYVKRMPEQPWRLEALSTVSAERSRALAERDHARAHVAGAQYLVRRFDPATGVPWTLEP